VYGPVQIELKPDFLRDLMDVITATEVPLIVGGDFNLVREAAEKSTGNVNESLVQLFNQFVDDVSLREMHRQGGSFTWTNKQEIPIMAVLDRVFVSNDWEAQFPLANTRSLTRVGSDHNPLLVETDSVLNIRASIFRFDATWLSQEGFVDWVVNKWPQRKKENILDHWNITSQLLRRNLRGWSINWGSVQRKLKQNLLLQLETWDRMAETRALTGNEWRDRYEKEEELMKIYENEELFWQRRGGEDWILKGDANTSYFHGIANGRKRKCIIKALVEEDTVLEDKEELKEHITNFYKKLFGREPDPKVRLGEDFWKVTGRLEESDNMWLTRPFSMSELETAVRDMKSNTAPGPDGFSTCFFKKFWGKVRDDILEMLHLLHKGKLDLARLNFGILVLLPKIKGANQIKQYRPICLLNVIYKIITKVLTIRLTSVINKVINEAQTAFIPGRFILDGVLVVHEILHDMRMKKKKGIILKLDFEKAYDKVNWKFLQDVLRRKNFNKQWIEWTMKVVQGGKWQ
jgi:hypothetical protein